MTEEEWLLFCIPGSPRVLIERDHVFGQPAEAYFLHRSEWDFTASTSNEDCQSQIILTQRCHPLDGTGSGSAFIPDACLLYR